MIVEYLGDAYLEPFGPLSSCIVTKESGMQDAPEVISERFFLVQAT